MATFLIGTALRAIGIAKKQKRINKIRKLSDRLFGAFDINEDEEQEKQINKVQNRSIPGEAIQDSEEVIQLLDDDVTIDKIKRQLQNESIPGETIIKAVLEQGYVEEAEKLQELFKTKQSSLRKISHEGSEEFKTGFQDFSKNIPDQDNVTERAPNDPRGNRTIPEASEVHPGVYELTDDTPISDVNARIKDKEDSQFKKEVIKISETYKEIRDAILAIEAQEKQDIIKQEVNETDPEIIEEVTPEEREENTEQSLLDLLMMLGGQQLGEMILPGIYDLLQSPKVQNILEAFHQGDVFGIMKQLWDNMDWLDKVILGSTAVIALRKQIARALEITRQLAQHAGIAWEQLTNSKLGTAVNETVQKGKSKLSNLKNKATTKVIEAKEATRSAISKGQTKISNVSQSVLDSGKNAIKNAKADAVKKMIPQIGKAQKVLGVGQLAVGGTQGQVLSQPVVATALQAIAQGTAQSDLYFGWRDAQEILGKDEDSLTINDRIMQSIGNAVSGLTLGIVSPDQIASSQAFIMENNDLISLSSEDKLIQEQLDQMHGLNYDEFDENLDNIKADTRDITEFNKNINEDVILNDEFLREQAQYDNRNVEMLNLQINNINKEEEKDVPEVNVLEMFDMKPTTTNNNLPRLR